MKLLKSHRRLVVAMACMSLASPSIRISDAAHPEAQQPSLAIRDVRLDVDGRLSGQLLNRQGNPIVDATLALWSRGEQLAEQQTNRRGEFQFAGLRGGVYEIVGHNVGGIYRAWMASTAPPASQNSILLVSGEAVRGQTYVNASVPPRQMGLGAGHYGGAIMRTLNNPWIIGGAIAAGIAVPIAVSNRDNDGS